MNGRSAPPPVQPCDARAGGEARRQAFRGCPIRKKVSQKGVRDVPDTVFRARARFRHATKRISMNAVGVDCRTRVPGSRLRDPPASHMRMRVCGKDGSLSQNMRGVKSHASDVRGRYTSAVAQENYTRPRFRFPQGPGAPVTSVEQSSVVTPKQMHHPRQRARLAGCQQQMHVIAQQYVRVQPLRFRLARFNYLLSLRLALNTISKQLLTTPHPSIQMRSVTGLSTPIRARWGRSSRIGQGPALTVCALA